MALLIIDMQPYFPAAKNKNVQAACIREIEKARAKKQWIVNVTYRGYGDTVNSIKTALKGYGKVVQVQKDECDGSSDIIEKLAKKKITISHFTVCGVNTSACVSETVDGLLATSPINITIPVDAVNDDEDYDPRDFWSGAKRIKVVERKAG